MSPATDASPAPPRTIVETEDGRFFEVENTRHGPSFYLAWPVTRFKADGFSARVEGSARTISRAHTRIVSPKSES